ncbi:Predicted oxidoreductase, contains short-chain dehydrogenase (SDR) and DUF2520 domains [Parafrankia irregularis]|uniref:Predicted oxidoreductase, contains short-chain dehydrogenase (SDR) and DUF2520 domains n=1 Tax=Parafrankia irregularis TaxID=795642 RepID=A0A0S4QFF1_9ACTN|nr:MULTISPECIES: Rossmann-like and DUF2520 domain-containing protein [Parafrankia]MBE3203086.1 DUF2520 domain-containing protein [Parafrankia sp. CH37]CUU54277.1 Predicted oxidoreductase, contains short-chain dehydrogenase (SDR) and DUF2520 domains [Parafrankia irregularis]
MEHTCAAVPAAGQSAAGLSAAGLSIAIVGPGRAGAAVGRALVAAGHQVRALHSRTRAGRDRAAALFPAAEVCATPAEAAARADVVLLGVPDDSIEQTAGRIAPGVARTPAVLVAHLSGRHGIAPLAPAAAVGARPAAIHPIMTLTGAATDPDRLVGATFGVTTAPGDEDTAGLVRHLVEGIGGRVAVIPEERRASYHAALVLGGNFLATLVTAAGQLLAAAGVPDPAEALGPLLRMSLDNALAHGEDAMTGPVRRGDVGTVTAQWSELTRRDPHLADAYGALAVLTADRLERSGLLPARTAAALRAGVARPDDRPHGP